MTIPNRVTLIIVAVLTIVTFNACKSSNSTSGGTNVTPKPAIGSFTATPSHIIFGGSSNLTWSVSNATSLSISPSLGAVSGSSVTVSPVSTTTYTLTASGAGGTTTARTTVDVKTIADTLSYSAPPAGGYRLFKNTTKSSAAHLVLDLFGPGGSLSGVGFYLAADQTKVTWTAVDTGDAEKIKSSVFSNALIKSKVAGDILQAGVYQKGIAGAINATTTTVLASVALDLKSGVLITNPPGVNLAAVSGKAVILNPPASSTATSPIAIAVGTLVAN